MADWIAARSASQGVACIPRLRVGLPSVAPAAGKCPGCRKRNLATLYCPAVCVVGRMAEPALILRALPPIISPAPIPILWKGLDEQGCESAEATQQASGLFRVRSHAAAPAGSFCAERPCSWRPAWRWLPGRGGPRSICWSPTRPSPSSSGPRPPTAGSKGPTRSGCCGATAKSCRAPTALAQEAVLWIDRAAAAPRAPSEARAPGESRSRSKVIAYLEGNVVLEFHRRGAGAGQRLVVAGTLLHRPLRRGPCRGRRRQAGRPAGDLPAGDGAPQSGLLRRLAADGR